jgi:uncharacterized protein with gpF-like domain
MTRREAQKKYNKRQAYWERVFKPKFLKVMKANNKHFTDNVRSFDSYQTVLDRTILPVSFRDLMLELYKKASIPQAKEVYNDTRRRAMKAFDIQDLWLSNVIEYLEKEGLDLLTQSIADTQKKRLILIIEKGIEEGLSYDQIVKLIQSSDIWVRNAERIARTETGRAMNYGHMVGAAALPFMTNKVWSAALDRRTRNVEDHFDHYHMNGQTVGYDQPFVEPKTGELIMFPCDPKASPGNTVNCRCRVYFEPIRDANGRTIPKLPTIPQLNARL